MALTETKPTFGRTLGHFLFGGLKGGLVGLVLAALIFYIVVLGLLYAEQPVLGGAQESVPLPNLNGIALAPPIPANDYQPPALERTALFDGDYFLACWEKVWPEIATQDVGMMLLAWVGAACLGCMALGVLSTILRFIFFSAGGIVFGILAFVVTLAAIGALVAHFTFGHELPLELNVQGRLLLYAAVAVANLVWISMAGFRLRAVLYTLATVATGELLVLGLPTQALTTTALWHGCLFLFVPTGYAWLAVEKGQFKEII